MTKGEEEKKKKERTKRRRKSMKTRKYKIRGHIKDM